MTGDERQDPVTAGALRRPRTPLSLRLLGVVAAALLLLALVLAVTRDRNPPEVDSSAGAAPASTFDPGPLAGPRLPTA